MTHAPRRTVTARAARLAAAAALTAALAVGGSATAFAGTTAATPKQGTWLSSTERTMLKTLDEQRASAGCQPLTTRRSLNGAAGAHASDMVARGYFSHTSPDGGTPWDRAKAFGTTANAENIAAGNTDGVAAAVQLWNSTGHRANIANCGLTKVGIGYDPGRIGITSGGVPVGNGSWVQLFAR